LNSCFAEKDGTLYTPTTFLRGAQTWLNNLKGRLQACVTVGKSDDALEMEAKDPDSYNVP